MSPHTLNAFVDTGRRCLSQKTPLFEARNAVLLSCLIFRPVLELLTIQPVWEHVVKCSSDPWKLLCIRQRPLEVSFLGLKQDHVQVSTVKPNTQLGLECSHSCCPSLSSPTVCLCIKTSFRSWLSKQAIRDMPMVLYRSQRPWLNSKRFVHAAHLFSHPRYATSNRHSAIEVAHFSKTDHVFICN